MSGDTIRKSTTGSADLISTLEKELMVGRGRWIADFYESFRNYQINDIVFDAYIRGNTRSSGFVISRVYSFFLNPNYEVACYAHSLDAGEKIDRKTIRKAILAVKDSMRASETKWSWVYLFGDHIDRDAIEPIRAMLDQTIGLVCVAAKSGQVYNNDTFLGRQARKYLKL